MSKRAIPPRIHVLLAREAPIGVVFRRGPSKRVCTVLWERESDTFQAGQWLSGRIYERRSDLSPDGRYLIYFAMWKGALTAISRAPYLKAIAYFPWGSTWHGGGLFTTEGQYWLNEGPIPPLARGMAALRRTTGLRRDRQFEPVELGAECTGVYYPRLLRDGWNRAGSETCTPQQRLDYFEKPLPGGWVLRKIAHAQSDPPIGRGCYWDEHELIHSATGRAERHPDWEWAEWDRDRLVWANGGCIYASELNENGIAEERLLFDCGTLSVQQPEDPY